jgi:hypothetical protein
MASFFDVVIVEHNTTTRTAISDEHSRCSIKDRRENLVRSFLESLSRIRSISVLRKELSPFQARIDEKNIS